MATAIPRQCQVSAEVGVLRAGHRTAAHLLNIELMRRDDTLSNTQSTATARVTYADRYWVTQPVLDLALDMGGGHWWCWRQVTVQLAAGIIGPVTITAMGDPVVVNSLQLL